MEPTAQRLSRLTVLAATAALFAACSDSPPAEAPAPPAPPPSSGGTVPGSALASPSAYTLFVRDQPKSETAKPLDLTGVNAAPVSETEAPLPI